LPNSYLNLTIITLKTVVHFLYNLIHNSHKFINGCESPMHNRTIQVLYFGVSVYEIFQEYIERDGEVPG